MSRLRLTAAAAVVALGATIGGVVAAGADAPHRVAVSALTITMTDGKIAVAGNTVAGGVNVTATTSGKSEGTPVVMRLQPGVTVARLIAFVKTHPNVNQNGLHDLASTALAFDMAQGTTHVSTVFTAADYVAFDSAAAGTMDEWPRTTFHVATTSQPASLPAPAATVHAIDFTFTTPATLTQGSVVRFENDGYLLHKVVGIEAENDSDAHKIAAALRAGDQATVVELASGAAIFSNAIDHGATIQRTVTADKGVWVLTSDMPTQDGRTDAMIGLTRIIHIV